MIDFDSKSPLEARGFTLVELLVSTTLVLVIMTMLLTTVSSTQRLWRHTSTKASQFQAARTGFEAMTRRLGQATLNTYWRAYDGSRSSTTAEYQFRRHSELQFLSGPASKIFTSPSISSPPSQPELAFPTQAVFFQAPLGHTEYVSSGELRDLRALDSMLTACGYFVEYGPDTDVPRFLRDLNIPKRHRFRLMELTLPSERLTLYRRFNEKEHEVEPQVLDASKNPYAGLVDPGGKIETSWIRPFWMEEALSRNSDDGFDRFRYARVLAENVVALIILPKEAQRDRPTPEALGSLAPQYAYDSWRVLRTGASAGLQNADRDNLLPPIVQVTMIAIDETSASRATTDPEVPPDWTNGLFTHVSNDDDYRTDLAELEKRLREDARGLTYRVFSTDVVIRGSKWSDQP